MGAPGAYAIARFRTGGRALSMAILMQLMIPSVALIVPLFVLFSKVHLLDTWIGLAIGHVSFNLPLAVWLMMGFFGEIPADLEEAGRVDGCTRFQAFRLISVPLVLSGVTATAIFIAIQSWNEFLFAVVLTSSARAQTLPVLIATLIHPVTDILYGPMCAAAVVALVPVFVFAFGVQKYLIRGMTAGALKA
jgi:multiple sugar transport system permease protein